MRDKENGSTLNTAIYRKSTHTNIYINWNSHSPTSWKIGTIKTLVKRAFDIVSTKKHLEEELKFLLHTFSDLNQYPKQLVESIISQERRNRNRNIQLNITPSNYNKHITLSLPYAGPKGENIINKMKKQISKTINKYQNNTIQTTNTRVTYNTKYLGSKFPIKDITKFKHNHNIVYKAKCPEKDCTSSYIGQTKCRLEKRAIQHNKTDTNSHLLKHSKMKNHLRTWLNDFEIIGRGYKTDFKRKISESLHIKDFHPDLNVQKISYNLSLFN